MDCEWYCLLRRKAYGRNATTGSGEYRVVFADARRVPDVAEGSQGPGYFLSLIKHNYVLF